jgi:hypothetical protein
MRNKPKRPFYPGPWKLWGRSGETKPNKRLVTVGWNAGRGRVYAIGSVLEDGVFVALFAVWMNYRCVKQ